MATSAAPSDIDIEINDLGPLAWVLEELRKSLDTAAKSLKRYVRDGQIARQNGQGAADASPIRIARAQLHQAVGALQMVGLGAPAHMLVAMEAAVQRFVDEPALCTDEAAAKIERSSFALTEYLEGLLASRAVSPIALFANYRDVQQLAGADRVHPADLWALEWQWRPVPALVDVPARTYDAASRARLDQSMLKLIKGDTAHCGDLRDICLGFAAAQKALQPATFWRIAAGCFEALGLGLVAVDLYVKRAASRILLQYATLARGETAVSDRLAHDLLFFCAQATPSPRGQAPALDAVRTAYNLARFVPVDYERVHFGRFDPALLAQARKRISGAKDSWTSLTGGDLGKMRAAVDQFGLVSDSLLKLYEPSAPLAQALVRTLDHVQRAGETPSTELAMELATALLFLEAAFEDLDPGDAQLAERMARLAERLEAVRAGARSQALEPWMEELYRRVSDRQTMGSVVGELRNALGELEKSLDQFFREPEDNTVLRDVPGQLAQMRGVLSVLGLDQASQAVLGMRDQIERLLAGESDPARSGSGRFDTLGNNLGALGFLIDMLSYQPVLAKKLFVYDAELGELKPLMGRVGHGAEPVVPAVTVDPDLLLPDALPAQVLAAQVVADPQAQAEMTVRLDVLANNAALAGQSDLAQTARQAAKALSTQDVQAASAALTQLSAAAAPAATAPPAPAPAADLEEDDLRDIFLEEAREVCANGRQALQELAASPADVSLQTTLRRAFHTLKGSSRMVGLNEFGEAAWAMEQVFNAWLAEQKPLSADLGQLASQALQGFEAWIADIANHADGHWRAEPFRHSADAMRLRGELLPLATGAVAQPAPHDAAAQPSADAVDVVDVFELPEPPAPAVEPAQAEPIDFSFDLGLPPAAEVPPQAAVAEPAAALTPEPAAPAFDLDFDLPSALTPPEPLAATPVDVPLTDFSFDLPAPPPDELPRVSPSALDALDLPDLDFPPPPAADPAPALALPDMPDLEIQGIDLDSLAALSAPDPQAAPGQLPATDFEVDLEALETFHALDAGEPAGVPSAATEALPPEVLQTLDEPGLALPDETPDVEALPAEALLAEAPAEEEPVKVVGDLRIPLPLYNVYLNEADEWSRRLVTELGEWALELHRPLPDAAVGLAHSLAGSSATVGFSALSDLARTLEHALLHLQSLAIAGEPAQAATLSGAADEIQRLLHQFAAGFLKEAQPQVVEELQALLSLQAAPTDSEMAALDDVLQRSGLAPAEPAPAEPAAPASPIELGPRGTEDPQGASGGDRIDPDLFPIFEEEAADLLPQLGGALRQWAARPDNASARNEALRALHTLKGSARLAGAMRMGDMAHGLESEIERIDPQAGAVRQIEPLLGRLDRMQAVFERLRKGEALPLDLHDEPLAAAAALDDSAAPLGAAADGLPAEPAGSGSLASGLQAAEAPAPGEAAPAAQRPEGARILAPSVGAVAARASGGPVVRVRSQLLDRMVNQAGEVMISRARLEADVAQLRGALGDLTGNLDRLRAQLRDIELQAESQMQTRLAQAKETATAFDPLEFDRYTRVQELTRMMAESVNDVATVQRTLQRTVETSEDTLAAQARQTRDLQRDLLRTRMVEFDGVVERLYRVVRQSAKELDKQVRLDIQGGSIELDRGMLERLLPAFEHLLRNCVAHGIEPPAVRSAAGKDPAGLIRIELQQAGNDVAMRFSDDGAGLDLAAIAARARSAGLLEAGQPLSVDEAARLIFTPGFSTASVVTELAGRGIGMDVVRSEVYGLGGRIETHSEAGQGTRFTLVLPLTTAVTQVVMLRAGGAAVGVPANLVESVRRTTPEQLQQAYASGRFEYAGESMPFFWSGALLQVSAASTEPALRSIPVVVFRSAAQRVALHVDEVLGSQEVVVKNLGPQLSRLPGLAGMTMLASGAVAMMYNPVALAAVYGEQALRLSAGAAAQAGAATEGPSAPLGAEAGAVARIPLVMVVDDSITVRRVTQRLLLREGYRVVLAADGLQALEKLQEELPAVVLSDIEMPRMDGFDLARNIRGDARLHDLPIVMITSRMAAKHREHAMQLGVNHYLGKPYSEEELLALVRQYCAAQTEVAA